MANWINIGKVGIKDGKEGFINLDEAVMVITDEVKNYTTGEVMEVLQLRFRTDCIKTWNERAKDYVWTNQWTVYDSGVQKDIKERLGFGVEL